MYITSITLLSSMLLILSTLMAVSSSNWLCLWISMELNMFSFIPIMLNSKTNLECEAAVKYFINQAFASALMIISSFLMWNKMNPFMLVIAPLLTLSILLKLGSSPCYMWFPSVMKAMSWAQSTILATWQKIAPMMIIFFNIKPLQIFMFAVVLMNIFIGGWLGMNQNNMRSLMAYSSIAHMGWMMAPYSINMNVTATLYFFLYLLITLPIFIMMTYYSMNTPSNSNSLMKLPTFIQMSFMLMILSIAGLPPLSGFFPKLVVLFSMIQYSNIILLSMLLLSLMSLYFYLNIAFSVLVNSKQTYSMNPNHNSNSILTYSTLSTIMLTPAIMLL
uniref:NADH dehydrogenase subunit 2 n=1 Tax=Barbronia yunnanensis TaxID=3027017 RepID=UPI0023D81E56|nr:NADH dehydrogenase subunit 2 [Barbronia yunnanensis]WDA96195.1 NADH dehydrogenase subunit 2 [Barbronia yunnanensis]